MGRGETAMAILRSAVWPPVVVFGLHVAASQALDAYARWPWLDVPMHLLGGAAIARFFARALEVLSHSNSAACVDGRVAALLVFALTCSAAVFWEFAEFVSDRVAGTSAQVSLEDTLLDLLLGIVGGTAYLAGSTLARRRASDDPVLR
jgi:hypothetical protein